MKKTEIEPLAKAIGLEFFNLGKYRPMYDTDAYINNCDKIINTYYVKTPSDLIHELAHFVVAPPEERKIINFGFFHPPDGPDCLSRSYCRKSFFGYQKKYCWTDYDSIHKQPHGEEAIASCLGILAEKTLKLPFENTMKYHEWNSWELFWITARKLRSIQLTDIHFNPSFLKGKLPW